MRRRATCHNLSIENDVPGMSRPRSALRDFQRVTYLMSRTAGDLSALQRGRLGKRLVRRQVTRRGFGPLLNALFRSL